MQPFKPTDVDFSNKTETTKPDGTIEKTESNKEAISTELIEKIYREFVNKGKFPERDVFLANHSEHIGLLDELEKNGILQVHDNCYKLFLNEIIGLSLWKREGRITNKILALLREAYKTDPKASWPIANVLPKDELGLEPNDIKRAFYYLSEWSFIRSAPEDPNTRNIIEVQPHEDVLRYRTIEDKIQYYEKIRKETAESNWLKGTSKSQKLEFPVKTENQLFSEGEQEMDDSTNILTVLDEFKAELEHIVVKLKSDNNDTLAFERFKRWDERLYDYIAKEISPAEAKSVAKIKPVGLIATQNLFNDFMVNYGKGAFSRLTALHETVEKGQIVKAISQPINKTTPSIATKKVFLVHGHDNEIKNEVARFLEKPELGLEVIILHEQPNQGRTLIEKFEDYATEGAFAVILLTPDDIGGEKSCNEIEKLHPRARQNVIFEFGFFHGTLGRSRVCALCKDVELPSDLSGVVYISLHGNWKFDLAKEIKNAGIQIDLNKLF